MSTKMADDPEDEVFDCLKGYRPDEYPTASEEARNAYYQGFITDYERDELTRGNAVINWQNQLVWLKEDRPTRLLTRKRMLEIQIDQLLGVGDGLTTHIESTEGSYGL